MTEVRGGLEQERNNKTTWINKGKLAELDRPVPIGAGCAFVTEEARALRCLEKNLQASVTFTTCKLSLVAM